MALALAPILLSAGYGFVLFDRGVIAPFHDVILRQREHLEPVQNLRALFWSAIVSIDNYLEDGDPLHVATYGDVRANIEAEIASLLLSVNDTPTIQKQIGQAHDTWAFADSAATSLMSLPPDSLSWRTASAFRQFHASIKETSDRLQVIYQQLAEPIYRDHNAAVIEYRRAKLNASIAVGASMIAAIGGFLTIGRILTGSVDRLVEGANRFADGDRNHRIDVSVPPELNRVAEEFNLMISRIEKSEKALEALALIDSLTGVSNRRAFDQAFSDLLSLHIHSGVSVTLMAIDLDHFKRINDTWGHPAGDEVLRTATRIMSVNIRSMDRLFRMGGEEFSILMTDTTLAEAAELGERLRAALEATTVEFEEAQIRFTASIGIAELGDGVGMEDLLAMADAALYRAKLAGRNRVAS